MDRMGFRSYIWVDAAGNRGTENQEGSLTMNANEMTYGVEFEVYLPAGTVERGGYHAGLQVPGLPAGWNAQSDSSLRSAPQGYVGVEIVSPILRGADGIEQIRVVTEWLASKRAKVNRTTGFHCHVGWTSDAKALARLVTYTSNFEGAFYAASGTKWRQVCGYTKSVRNQADLKEQAKAGAIRPAMADRYSVLNVTNLAGRKHTVEFRAFAGTTQFTKAVGYVRMCLGLVEKAVKTSRMPKWDIAPENGLKADGTPWTPPCSRKAGAGSTQMARLFACLAWSRKTDRQLDDQFGIAADSPASMTAIRAELVRLAAKYDASTPNSDQPE